MAAVEGGIDVGKALWESEHRDVSQAGDDETKGSWMRVQTASNERSVHVAAGDVKR